MFLTALFLMANVFSPEIARVTGIQYDNSIIAYAKGARGSSGASGGFKSGSFKSSSSNSTKSSSGGFKSGSFSNSDNSSSPSSKSYNSGTKRSYIPIPIPWGSSRNVGQSLSGLGSFFAPIHFVGSIVFGIFKFILLAIVFIIIFNIIRRLRRRF